MFQTDSTHAPQLRSWVHAANDDGTDFPLQNLPFARFRPGGSSGPLRIGVAIGDQVLDLARAGLAVDVSMNTLMAWSPAQRVQLRHALSEGLREGSPLAAGWAECLMPTAKAEFGLPCDIGDYTDFYTGIHHATAVGRLFRPDQPLMPNYKWVPIGYHGRASSARPSGEGVRRPMGQTLPADAARPVVGPTRRLDYELELGYWMGRGNAQGTSIPLQKAEQHLFGVGLLNDWSARDVQAWEYQPLGPFLAKNFATTVSPWIVTVEALAPFRGALQRAADDPRPLAYLDDKDDRQRGGFDIQLEVWLCTSAMRRNNSAPVRIGRSSALDAAYWSASQLITHHTMNGCNLQPGDLLGSGTLSGQDLEQAGSLLERTKGGKSPFTLPNGEQRTFLEDGDQITMRGCCVREGARRVGFGEAQAIIHP